MTDWRKRWPEMLIAQFEHLGSFFPGGFEEFRERLVLALNPRFELHRQGSPPTAASIMVLETCWSIP